jgi:hypothetical protein
MMAKQIQSILNMSECAQYYNITMVRLRVRNQLTILMEAILMEALDFLQKHLGMMRWLSLRDSPALWSHMMA